jgi:AraC-like DNA-binding protein
MLQLPERVYLAVWEAIVGLAGGDHGVGALLARHAGDRTFGVAGEALHHSPTLVDAYARLTRYSRLLHQEATVTIKTSSRDFIVGYAWASTGHEPVTGARAASLLWAVGCFALVPRRFFNEQIMPRTTALSCPPPADMNPAREIFGQNILFNAGQSQLVFARGEVEKVRRPNEEHVLTYLDALVERDLGDLPSLHDIITVVSVEVRRRLIGGAPTIDTVARSLCLSPRTLQRRIRDGGSCFADILDEVRKSRAEELLCVNVRPISEIAYMLGYSEQASFSRAVRRWFGTTPRELVKKAAADPL